VAVLVNRAALAASLGDKATPDAIDKQVKEIEQLVSSAAGLRKERGDAVKISVVDFVDSGKDMEPVPAPSFLEVMERQTGNLVSAGVVLLVAVLLILFGIRPVTRALLATPPIALEAPDSSPDDGMGMGMAMAMAPSLDAPESMSETLLIKSADGRDQFLDELLERKDKSPQRHLQKLVDFDEEHAAAILKQWIRQGANG
jgi:flagellar M-ring protein FliF